MRGMTAGMGITTKDKNRTDFFNFFGTHIATRKSKATVSILCMLRQASFDGVAAIPYILNYRNTLREWSLCRTWWFRAESLMTTSWQVSANRATVPSSPSTQTAPVRAQRHICIMLCKMTEAVKQDLAIIDRHLWPTVMFYIHLFSVRSILMSI